MEKKKDQASGHYNIYRSGRGDVRKGDREEEVGRRKAGQ
jgi:hypothetical protein